MPFCFCPFSFFLWEASNSSIKCHLLANPLVFCNIFVCVISHLLIPSLNTHPYVLSSAAGCISRLSRGLYRRSSRWQCSDCCGRVFIVPAQILKHFGNIQQYRQVTFRTTANQQSIATDSHSGSFFSLCYVSSCRISSSDPNQRAWFTCATGATSSP